MSRITSRKHPPKFDIEGLSDEGLQELRDTIDAEIRRRAAVKRAAARRQILEIAKANAIDLAELGGSGSVPRYRNPDNQFETWNGRGRQPRWFKAQIATGKSPEDMRIQ